MNSKKIDKIIVYGTAWCGDCARSKAFLDSVNVPYEFIDISNDQVALNKVLELNHGMQSVPTILFPDGMVLIEPTNTQLAKQIAESNILNPSN